MTAMRNISHRNMIISVRFLRRRARYRLRQTGRKGTSYTSRRGEAKKIQRRSPMLAILVRFLRESARNRLRLNR